MCTRSLKAQVLDLKWQGCSETLVPTSWSSPRKTRQPADRWRIKNKGTTFDMCNCAHLGFDPTLSRIAMEIDFRRAEKKETKLSPVGWVLCFFLSFCPFRRVRFQATPLCMWICVLYTTQKPEQIPFSRYSNSAVLHVFTKNILLCVLRISRLQYCTGTQSIICNTRRKGRLTDNRRRFVRLVLPVVLCCLPVVSDILSD